MIKATIFGLDGTLVDSHDAHFAARREVLDIFGVTLTRASFDSTAGASLDEALTGLFADQQVAMTVPLSAIEALVSTAYLSHVAGARRLPHTTGFLTGFRDVLRMAVASGAPLATVQPTLETVGLAEAFDAVVTRDDAARGKPDPELFLLAAERMGVQPEECLVMDHSAEGLEAARRAGMASIDVRGAHG